MQQFGRIKIEHDKVITPNGHIPLSAESEVNFFYTPASKYAKRAAGVGLFIAACVTGGAGLLLFGPAIGFLNHDSYRVIVSTNGDEFFVEQFGGTGLISDPKADAVALRDAIANAIRNLRE